jgi:hypothetical protein
VPKPNIDTSMVVLKKTVEEVGAVIVLSMTTPLSLKGMAMHKEIRTS